jgi:hypothetical protein
MCLRCLFSWIECDKYVFLYEGVCLWCCIRVYARDGGVDVCASLSLCVVCVCVCVCIFVVICLCNIHVVMMVIVKYVCVFACACMRVSSCICPDFSLIFSS